MLDALTSLQLVEQNLARSQAATAADPAVKRASADYLARIKSVTTAKDFVQNYSLFSFAMKAYGLSDLIYAKAFMEKVMDGGVSNPKSLANELSDPRFKAFAQAFDFGDKGATATTDDAVNAATVAKYVEQTLEDNVGQQNQGAQLALYFQRQAPQITSGMQILADKALLQFVETTFNLPLSSGASLDVQAKEIESKLNLKDLRDPAKVKNLMTRFAALWDLQNTDPTAANPALALITQIASGSNDASQAIPSFSSDLLLQAQKLYAQV